MRDIIRVVLIAACLLVFLRYKHYYPFDNLSTLNTLQETAEQLCHCNNDNNCQAKYVDDFNSQVDKLNRSIRFNSEAQSALSAIATAKQCTKETIRPLKNPTRYSFHGEEEADSH